LAESASFDVLIDKIRPAVFAVGDDKKKTKGREGKVHKVTRHYVLAICGADTPGSIPIKIWHACCPKQRNQYVQYFVINFFSGVADLQGVKIPVFPLTLLAIVTTVLRYRAASDIYQKCTLDNWQQQHHHRLRSSASPVLTATHHSYGSLA